MLFVFLSNFPQNFVLKDWFAIVIMGCLIQCDPAVLLSQVCLELSLNIVDSEVNQGLLIGEKAEVK